MDLQPGDPFATEATGLLRWALMNLIEPPTDRFHFGIIWGKKSTTGDFIILESVSSKGLSIGLLSWYDVSRLKFYRVNCPAELRRAAPGSLLAWGRAKYDYLLVPKLVFGFLLAFVKILIREGKIRRLRAGDLPYSANSSLICTEAVDVAFDSVGVNVIPIGVVPIPNAFREAETEGRMSELTE